MKIKVCHKCKKIYPFTIRYCNSCTVELRGVETPQIIDLKTKTLLSRPISKEGFSFSEVEVSYDPSIQYNLWLKEQKLENFIKTATIEIVNDLVKNQFKIKEQDKQFEVDENQLGI